MEIKQILLLLTPNGARQPAVDIASRLARQNNATVEGACLYLEPTPTVAEGFAVGPQAVGDVLEHRRAKIVELTAGAASDFHEGVTRRGLSEGWRVGAARDSFAALIQRARLSDLVVLCRPEHDPDYRELVETLAVKGGAPCLMVPPGTVPGREFKRVLVAWNGSREAKQAMVDAMGLLRQADCVGVLTIAEDGARSVDSAQSDALLRHLARHGVHASLVRTSGRGKPAGELLIEQAESFGADLLVMGAFGHSRASELILGGATRTILAKARIPTLFSH